MLPKDQRLFALLCGRQDLTVEDVNSVSCTLLYKMTRAVSMESES